MNLLNVKITRHTNIGSGLGNVLLSLANLIKKYEDTIFEINIISTEFNFITGNKIIFKHVNKCDNFDEYNNELIDVSDFYYYYFNKDKIDYDIRRYFFQKYIYNLLTFNTVNISQDTLTIHIRSGDQFSYKNIGHDDYIPPPLAYYKKILQMHNYKNILIITEPDKLNPLIKLIKNKFNNVHIQSLSLIDDFSTLCNSVNLCLYPGTFSLVSSYLNKKLKNLYNPIYSVNRDPYFGHNMNSKNINIYNYQISNYIEKWNNNEEQYHMIQFHPINEIKLI